MWRAKASSTRASSTAAASRQARPRPAAPSKWSCAARGCACGYPVARTDWTVRGHPELTVEVTQDIDGNLIIRVM